MLPPFEMVAKLIAAMAQLERDTISERVRAGMANAKERGVKVGRPVVGPPVEVIAKEHDEEGWSFRDIAKKYKVAYETVRKRYADWKKEQPVIEPEPEPEPTPQEIREGIMKEARRQLKAKRG